MDAELEKRRRQSLVTELALIWALVLYLGLHLAHCVRITRRPDGTWDLLTLQGVLEKNLTQPLAVFPLDGAVAAAFAGAGVIASLLRYQKYLQERGTLLGREHGSASFNTDWRGLLRNYVMSPAVLRKTFKRQYRAVRAPGGRKICRKRRFAEREIAACRMASQLYSKHVALSLDTSLTQLNLNAIVFGGSGSGKSRFFVMPNLLQANSSYVVTDPSGELMAGTAKFLQSRGYTIRCLNIEHMEASCRYNPFAYVKEDADILIMVNALLANIEGPRKGGSGDNKFWDETSQTLLTALCGYLFEVCRDDNAYLYAYETDKEGNLLRDENGKPRILRDAQGAPVYRKRQKRSPNGESMTDAATGKEILEPIPNPHWKGCRNFSNVLSLLEMADVDDDREVEKDDLDLLFEDLERANPSSYAVSQYKVIKQAGTGKTAQNIIISTSAIFARFFKLDKIENLTYRDEMHLEELGRKKCALFIVTPQGDTTYNFLASMLYTQLFATLYHQGEENARTRRTTSVKLDVPVRCLIDEAANIGVIPQFSEKLATMRKYGISACPIYQNQAQVKNLFKDNWETIVGNCDTMLFLGGIDSGTVKTVSERLGKGTIYTDSSSVTRGRQGSSSQSRQKMARELMTTTEIEQMKNDHCIVFIRSMKPWYDLKYPLEQHPNYRYSGMYQEKNAFVAPWHLKMDRDLLRRIRVRRTTDPDYLSPERAEGVLEEDVRKVVRAQRARGENREEENRKEEDRVEESSICEAGRTQNGSKAHPLLEPMAVFLRKNPGVGFRRREETAGEKIPEELYEDDPAFARTLLQNLEQTPAGREILEKSGVKALPVDGV